MKRRTLLKTLGAAAVGILALGGGKKAGAKSPALDPSDEIALEREMAEVLPKYRWMQAYSDSVSGVGWFAKRLPDGWVVTTRNHRMYLFGNFGKRVHAVTLWSPTALEGKAKE